MIPGKLKWYAILALALWLAFSGVAAAEQLYVNESGWWRDGGVFNVSETPIQVAVDNATAGGSVFVWNGSYSENVDVNKTLTLDGEGADVVTVTAADPGDHVFEVKADYVNISGFVVRGATDNYRAGIRLTNADYCNISENNAYGDAHCIYLSSSSNNTLTSNTASNNMYGSGITLSSSSNNTLANNTANSNKVHGITLSYSSNNASNNDYRGIYLAHSSNYNTLTNNTASNNDYGTTLSCSSNNTLTSNTANSNTDYGIYHYNADNNNIACNLVQGNGQGFYLTSGSTGNNISYNNIIENGNYNTETGGCEWQFDIEQYQPVEAKHNYWGAGMNNSTIDASIYEDAEGRWGEVAFYPFETEPVPCAPGPKRPAFTTADAVIALQIAAGSRPPDPRWDVSGDGSVTSLDALMILQAAAHAIDL